MPKDPNAIIGWNEEFTPQGCLDGYYPFKVVYVEKFEHSGSSNLVACPGAKVKIEVIDDENDRTVTIDHKFFMIEKCRWSLENFFASIFPRDGNPIVMDFGKAIGKIGTCKCVPHEYNGREYNSIKTFLPATRDGASTSANSDDSTPF